jgi:hypothetical protein
MTITLYCLIAFLWILTCCKKDNETDQNPPNLNQPVNITKS